MEALSLIEQSEYAFHHEVITRGLSTFIVFLACEHAREELNSVT